VAGVRWLALDYLDNVHGECQKSFPWEIQIPGINGQTRTSEFRGGDSTAPVRHQRIEFRMPNFIPREELETFRDDVARTLNQKSFRLELHEEKLLFELRTTNGFLRARIKIVPPLVSTPEAKPASRNPEGASIRRVEFRVPTIENHAHLSLSLTTDSQLPSGEYLVGLLQRPDGRVEELPASTALFAGKQGTRSLIHIIWQMSLFDSNRVLEIAAGVKSAFDGRLVDFTPDKSVPVFRATNQQGGVAEGFIVLRSQNAPPSTISPVSISILEVPQAWPYFISTKLRISAPAGYMPQAVGLLGEDPLETHTSRTGDGRTEGHCLWYFPQEFSKNDVEEVVRQIATARSTDFRVTPGERVPVFAVTNQAGAAFRGYFELPMTPMTK